jgi:hypothetical protein
VRSDWEAIPWWKGFTLLFTSDEHEVDEAVSSAIVIVTVRVCVLVYVLVDLDTSSESTFWKMCLVCVTVRASECWVLALGAMSSVRSFLFDSVYEIRLITVVEVIAIWWKRP